MNKFWVFLSGNSWKSRIWVDFDRFWSISTKILDFQDFRDQKTQNWFIKIELCKISSVQNLFMVPENAFPAFKRAALAGKAAANSKQIHQFPGSAGFPMDFIEIHHFEDFQWFLKSTVFVSRIAATFPAGAAGLNAGNAFSGTIQTLWIK